MSLKKYMLENTEKELTKLVLKYNRPGPRYTSYPTVPNWPEGFFSEEYKQALKKEGKSECSLAVYIHIPFCSRLCTFCGCNKVITRDADLVELYLDAIEKEVEAVVKNLGKKKMISQVHLGGGTPTHLKLEQLLRLTKLLQKNFEIDPEGEWAFEANPRVTTKDQLKGLFESGFKRVSFGIQDFDQVVQRAINRNQTPEQTLEVYNESRKIGYKSINFDLVYGLPKQTQQSFSFTLQEVSRLGPDRLAVYSFAHLPWMFKAHERALVEKDLPSAGEKIRLYLDTINHFTSEGYVMIGMDHFSLVGDELARAAENNKLHRNFMGYTTLDGMSQLGLGVSAISDFGDSYWQNPKELQDYIDQASDLVPQRGICLSEDDILRRSLIDHLMCQGEISISEIEQSSMIKFSDYFQKSMKKLKEFEADRLLTMDSECIKLNATGRLFLRNIAMAFDSYLTDLPSKRFSNTV